jgi:lipoprotein-anchoring transpeptidase ErfK/SrfK
MLEFSSRPSWRSNGGIGFHGIPVKNGTPLATPLGQRPVSAGCIRMADNDAKAVFDQLPVGASVTVTR